MKTESKWKFGRRFVVTLVGMALVMLNKKLGLDLSPEEVWGVAGLAASYVLGKSADNAAASWGIKKAAAENGKPPDPPAPATP